MRVLSLCFCAAILVTAMGASPGEGTQQDYRHKLVHSYMDNGAWQRLWIVTGGQAGVDRASLDVAAELKLPCRGWCPANRQAEDGPIAANYPMQETESEDPALRTELNVLDSDATLVITVGKPQDGTPLTVTLAKRYNRPVMVIDLEESNDKIVDQFREWVKRHNIRVLNIGGPRESHRPGFVYKESKALLMKLLKDQV